MTELEGSHGGGRGSGRTYVLVHGAWHSGDLLEDVAAHIRRAGNRVHTPTLKGNGPDDSKKATLTDAIEGLCAFFIGGRISDAIVYCHSYGGMPTTGAADRLPAGTIRRLIYHNAFVPLDGESLEDSNAPAFNKMIWKLTLPDGGVPLPFQIWRESLMNDANLEMAKSTYARLNNHPHGTKTEKIWLSKSAAEFEIGKSYLDSVDDNTRGRPHGWLMYADRLGLYRYHSMPGGHEVCFTNPRLLAEKIIEAGQD